MPYPDLKIERDAKGTVKRHVWQMPKDPEAITGILTDIFTNYWNRVIFGPILNGVAYELTCPTAPDRFQLSNGYFTIGFNGPHFHLCVGPGAWGDTPEGRKNMPGSAILFRLIDSKEAPTSWGYELRNGADEALMTIWFDNPFLTGPDQIADAPDFSRLSMWRDISHRYLGLAADGFDETSEGFKRAAA